MKEHPNVVMIVVGQMRRDDHLKRYCERLEATGRGRAVPLLKERHPEEFR